MPAVDLALEPAGPYDLARSASGPLDLTRGFRAGRLRVALPTPDGAVVATVVQRHGTLVARLEGDRPEHAAALLAHVLAVDVDTRVLDAFRADPLLGPALGRARGRVRLRCATPAHALLRAVCGQLVRGRDARRFEAAIIRLAGCADVAELRCPPDAAALRRLSPAALASSGLHPRRAEVLARALRVLDLDALAGAPTAELVRRVRAQPGLGPWTAGALAMDGYGRLDAGLAGDLGLMRLLALELGREATADECVALLDRYAPWQALAGEALLHGHPGARLHAPPGTVAAFSARARGR